MKFFRTVEGIPETKGVLDMFLEHGAISQEHHDKSLRALAMKMREELS